MKTKIFITIIILFICSFPLSAEIIYFEVGSSPGTCYAYYFEDLKRANEGNIPYRTARHGGAFTWIFSLHFHYPDESHFLFGTCLYSHRDTVYKKTISNDINEKKDTTSICTFSLDGKLRYYWLQIGKGIYTQGSLGYSLLSVDKGENADLYSKDSKGNIIYRLGLGYAFEIEPMESAVHLGMDVYYMRDRWSEGGQKENWSLLGTEIYVSILW